MKRSPTITALAAAGALAVMTLRPAGAMADVYAYEGTGTDQFGVIDLTTGVFTERGNMGMLLSGLGAAGGGIYGGVEYGDTLYRVNPANGALTSVGNGGISYWDFGSTTTGLYALGHDYNLYQINPSNGAATLVGPIGLSGLAGTLGMSANSSSSSLYLTSNSLLYSLNTSTGAATLIGNAGIGNFGAEVVLGGTIYAGSDTPPPPYQVYTLNASNGSATLVSTVSGGASTFWGLAPIAVPEPSTWAMMLTGLIGVGLVARRPTKKVAGTP